MEASARLLREAFAEWRKDDGSLLAAALAYYYWLLKGVQAYQHRQYKDVLDFD